MFQPMNLWYTESGTVDFWFKQEVIFQIHLHKGI